MARLGKRSRIRERLRSRVRERSRSRIRERSRVIAVVMLCAVLVFCCAMVAPASPETAGSQWGLPFGNDPQNIQPPDTEKPTDDTGNDTDESEDKKRDEDDGGAEDESVEGQPPPVLDTQSLLNNPVVIIAAMCAIAVIILAALYISAKRRAAPAAARQAAPPAVRSAESAPAQTPRGTQAANIQGLGARRNQQDSFGVTDVADAARGVFAIVADGMGGIANGAEISQITTSYMLQVFKSSPPAQNPAAFLLGLVSGAQERARAFIEGHGNQLSGSTVVAAVVRNGGLHFVSIGDSRIYLLRGGALIQLNREHTCASQLDEQAARGEISLEQARNDPQRNALTSYIGLDGQLLIDGNAQPIPVRPGDRLLLMSDGVFGVMSEAELTQAASLPSLYESAAALERAVKAKQRPNQDNYTAILLAF